MMRFKNLSKLLVATMISFFVNTSLHAGDIDQGKAIFQQCSICHNIEKGAGAKVGPNLWGVVNSAIGGNADYAGRYSATLQNLGGNWSVNKISRFVESPQTFASGTYMGFAGLSNPQQRADLIAYLNSQSDTPSKYQLEESAGTTQQNQAPSEANIGKLFRAPGAEKTFVYCSACHSERIVTQQGLTKADWQELLEWMVDEQGMDEISEPDYTLVIDYLSTNYGTDRPNFPKK